MSKYDEQIETVSVEYAKLPVPVNYVKWTNGKLTNFTALKTDPILYLGGWSGSIEKYVKDGDNIPYPPLPFPIVERMGERDVYKLYASPVLRYQIISTRYRYELREKDAAGNVVKNRYNFPNVLATTKHFVAGSGYTPVKEVFALASDKNGKTGSPILIVLSGQGSFKSHTNAEKQFQGIAAPEGKVLLRAMGTRGVNKDGVIKPVFAEFPNGHKYNPIDALDLDKVLFVDITPEFDELWNLSQAWAKCSAWNAEKVFGNSESVTEGHSAFPVGEVDLTAVPDVNDDFPFGTPTEEDAPFSN